MRDVLVQTMKSPKCIAIHAGMLDYAFALCLMEAIVEIKRLLPWPEFVLLLEHPPVITLGRRARREDILCPIQQLKDQGIGIHHVDRGRPATYHGPGQLVGYLLLDSKRCKLHPSQLVEHIETALVALLARYGIAARQSSAHRGVWVAHHKIASIGIGVRGGITIHGFALNCNPNLSRFDLINPCGLGPGRMTSMTRLSGKPINSAALGLDLPVEPLGKLLEDVYSERPDAFIGIPSDKAGADQSGDGLNVRRITKSRCEPLAGIL